MVTMSPSPTSSSRADFGLIKTALSQVSLVMGSGSSCNQPLLAKRPSQRVGDAVNRKVQPSPVVGSGATEPPVIDGETALVADPSTTPSCSAVRQAAVLPKKFASTWTRAGVKLPIRAESTSIALRPPKRGITRGWAMEMEPSPLVTSFHASSQWAAGKCHVDAMPVSLLWAPRWMRCAALAYALVKP